MKQIKEKGKTKSEKVRSSLLFTFSLLLFTSAANAAEITINVGEGQTFAYAIDDGELVQTKEEGPAKVTFAANRNATYSFYGVAEDGTVSLIKSVEMTDAGETVNETGNAQVAVDTRATKVIDGSAGAVKVDLTYSGDNWGSNLGGSATITLALGEGEAKPYRTGLKGNGTVEWTPPIDGTYVFTHTVGEAEETATFNVVGFPGGEGRPWEIGAGDEAAVTAYVKDGYLYLEGKGAVKEFTGDAPWAILNDMLEGIGPLSKGIVIPASVLATLPITVEGGAEPLGYVKADGFSAITVDPATQKAMLSVVISKTDSLDEPEWKPVSTNDIPVQADTPSGFFIVTPAAPSNNSAADKIIEDR